MTAIALPRQRYSAWRDKLRSIQLGLGARGAVGLGLGESEPAAVGSGTDWSTWFGHFYDMKNAASQAASYLDLVGSQNWAVGTAPTWSSGTGLTFDGSTQYLSLGITLPANATVLVRFSGSANGGAMFGERTSGQRIGCYMTSPTQFFNGNGNKTVTTSTAGVIGISDRTGYFNGAPVVTSLPAWSVTPSSVFALGAMFDGTAFSFWSGNVQAVGIKIGALSGAQVAAATAEMAAL